MPHAVRRVDTKDRHSTNKSRNMFACARGEREGGREREREEREREIRDRRESEERERESAESEERE
jgi:hypothetical protein